jgi:hypothetical protein
MDRECRCVRAQSRPDSWQPMDVPSWDPRLPGDVEQRGSWECESCGGVHHGVRLVRFQPAAGGEDPVQRMWRLRMASPRPWEQQQ